MAGPLKRSASPRQSGGSSSSSSLSGHAAAVLRRSVSWVEPTSTPRRSARLEEEIGGKRNGNGGSPNRRQPRLLGRRHREDADRDTAVVAQREADFAIVIGQFRHDRGDRCRQGRDGPSRPYMKGSCVMMPG